MRALVKRGFCISPGVYAVVGQTVDLPAGLYAEMLRRESIEPAAEEAPAAAADEVKQPTPAAKAGTKGTKP